MKYTAAALLASGASAFTTSGNALPAATRPQAAAQAPTMAVAGGINGFGRIGRLVARIMAKSDAIDLKLVNSGAANEYMAYQFKYDSIHGRYPGTIEPTADGLMIDGVLTPTTHTRDPSEIPFGAMGAEYICAPFLRKTTSDEPWACPSGHSGVSTHKQMSKLLAKRKAKDATAVDRRILILDPEKCKPNSAAYAFLKQYAGKCGKTCIEVEGKLVRISEDLCAACLTRAKHCPGGAVSIVKLPTNLSTDVTHRYGENAFALHGLPSPRPGAVLGLLGTNGIGKSTAVHILSGRVKPNLGVLTAAPPAWADIIQYYRGSDLQNYFTALCEDRLRVVVKPQLEPSLARKFTGRTVGACLEESDELGKCREIMELLDLEAVRDREVQALSGGELQRFAIARCLNVAADVYLFDEPSSFLDVKQRVAAAQAIRSLVDGVDAAARADSVRAADEARRRAGATYVVVVEHDLTVLDNVSDAVCCLYGGPGAYGVVTKRQAAAAGINQFLAGYIAAENMRFRAEALSFQVSVERDDDGARGVEAVHAPQTHRYPAMSRTLTGENSSFTLDVEAGSFRDGEVVGLMGENGCGKSTFMSLLAGVESDAPAGASLARLGVAYKRQHVGPRFRKYRGSVQDFLEAHVQHGLGDRLFRLLVMKPLGLERIEELPVRSLSGGEVQRLAIVVCLGTPAGVYLVDEPSAGLDVEQRIVCAKVMKRWVVSHLGKTAFIIEHDFVMATALYDRVVVYRGAPGVRCTAGAPLAPAEGFNAFLRKLDVTFRRDAENFRPRINKRGSVLDREQKQAGDYYNLDDGGGGGA